MPDNIGDDDIAVVDGVLDIDDVVFLANLGEANLYLRRGGVGVEVVDIEFDVVLGAGRATAEELAHKSHIVDSGCRWHRSYVRLSPFRGGLYTWNS